MQEEEKRKNVKEALMRVPPDIRGAIEAHGIVYRESPDLIGPSAIIITKTGDMRPIIEVRSSDPERVRALSAAYELMRLILGGDKIETQSKSRRTPGGAQKPVRHDTTGNDDIDPSTGLSTQRLMRSAMDLLMPWESLEAFLKANKDDVTLAAKAFQVPEQTVILKINAKRGRK